VWTDLLSATDASLINVYSSACFEMRGYISGYFVYVMFTHSTCDLYFYPTTLMLLFPFFDYVMMDWFSDIPGNQSTKIWGYYPKIGTRLLTTCCVNLIAC
jgi:hypothetical protein